MFFTSVILVIYKSRKSDREGVQLKAEKFLEDYKTLNPTRYTYSDIKRITSKFKHKLGQGGYGSVYKGKLSDGIPVAVKILEHSNANGEDFINEVSIIGRIHHFSTVHLLGFCSEGTRRAIIYEFMLNGSLEKFIFPKMKEPTHRLLIWEKLQKIATGVARGIEYLHQGFKQIILHFDIKPHNIRDHNFQPKISDFGMAKLCSKETSVVSMTAARRTTGYIAPELFSKNFGDVSYKADVFSYGMMLFRDEMMFHLGSTDTLFGGGNSYPTHIKFKYSPDTLGYVSNTSNGVSVDFFISLTRGYLRDTWRILRGYA